MQMRESHEWLVLNDIIYKVYTTKNVNDMCKGFLAQLKTIIDFDSADFMLKKGRDGEKFEPIVYNCEIEEAKELEQNQYSLGMISLGRSMVYRDSDMLSEDERKKTEYYQHVYIPNNWHYSLQMTLAYDKEFIGSVTLYKTIGKEDFKYDDIFFLDMLKEHVSYRLYQAEVEVDSTHRISLKQAMDTFNLTKREAEIISYLLKGRKNEEIAEILVISLNTLKKHLMNIYKKMHINSKNEILTMIRQDD